MGASAAFLIVACTGPPADAPAAHILSDTPLRVTGGEVQGPVSATNPDIMAFKGIPYAAPPVDDLRWRPPQAVVAWDGVRDASETGSSCVQSGGQGVPQSEDCLFLNVWASRETSEPLPVMVWIHGGGFTIGSSSQPFYDGGALARRGVGADK